MLKNKGFTLVESLVVIILVSLLAFLGIHYGRRNIKMAAINEGKSLISSIVVQEKKYFAENYTFLTTSGKQTKIEGLIDINTVGDFFNKFEISQQSMTSGGYTDYILEITMYPNTDKHPDFNGVYVKGKYSTYTNEIKYEENYD